MSKRKELERLVGELESGGISRRDFVRRGIFVQAVEDMDFDSRTFQRRHASSGMASRNDPLIADHQRAASP